MKYLKGTRNLELTLTGDQVSSIIWYINASFALHRNCKGHTWGLMTFGHGLATRFSQKQKFNTKSSTEAKSSIEAKLVGFYDALQQVLWTLYFMKG